MFDKIFEAKTALESLTVYRGLLQDAVIAALHAVLKELCGEMPDFSRFINSYSNFYYKLLSSSPEVLLESHISNKIIYDDNAFSRQSEEGNAVINLVEAAERDLWCLRSLASLTPRDIKDAALEKYSKDDFSVNMIKALPEWNPIGSGLQNVSSLADFHKKNGVGDFAKYKGFIWERSAQVGYLKGISGTDPMRLSDFIGYETERQAVVDNTLQFLSDHPANNVLLYGDRGTGKSATVKALLNEYGDKGLRMIELPKAFLTDLPYILRAIEGRKQKFIIFVDDLAFEDNEEEYTALKALLEGSLETKAANVVIYATSNRRHLVKEKFSERMGLMSSNHDDEVRAADTIQEKLSLADRFGITVTFVSPDQDKYLAIVEGLAKARNLDIDAETLRREAIKWELFYNGRSARTARQFVDWLAGQ